jgi:3-oxoacyl-[acyl-carrier-protein] synthase-3
VIHDCGATAGASRIASVGIELPRRRLSTADLLASCRHPVTADLERLTGIRERRLCAEGEDSFTMAAAAAADCLNRAGCPAAEVEMLVSCSISKGCADLAYVYEPPMSVAIQRAIGAERAICFDVANACAGMITGLAIVDDFIRRGAIRRGLVVSGEFISHIGRTATRHVTGTTSPQMPSLTLGDAGAAVLVERADDGAGGILACELKSFADYCELCIAEPTAAGDEPGWAMSTDALRLHRIAIDASVPTIAEAFARAGVGFDQIDWVIPHQTTEHAIRLGTERLVRSLGARGFRAEIVYNLDGCGNTASTTHFLALHRCLLEGRLQPGHRVLLLCFASGVVVGAVVFEVDDALVGRYWQGAEKGSMSAPCQP